MRTFAESEPSWSRLRWTCSTKRLRVLSAGGPQLRSPHPPALQPSAAIGLAQPWPGPRTPPISSWANYSSFFGFAGFAKESRCSTPTIHVRGMSPKCLMSKRMTNPECSNDPPRRVETPADISSFVIRAYCRHSSLDIRHSLGVGHCRAREKARVHIARLTPGGNHETFVALLDAVDSVGRAGDRLHVAL